MESPSTGEGSSSTSPPQEQQDSSSKKQKQHRERVYWTPEEDELLHKLVAIHGSSRGKGSQWPLVAAQLPGRNIKDCRKRWFHSLAPDLKKGRWSKEEDALLLSALAELGPVWYKIAQMIPGRKDDQCSKRYREVLDPSLLKHIPWTSEEDTLLLSLYDVEGPKWQVIAKSLPGRTGLCCRNRWRRFEGGKSAPKGKGGVRGVGGKRRLEAKQGQSSRESPVEDDGDDGDGELENTPGPSTSTESKPLAQLTYQNQLSQSFITPFTSSGQDADWDFGMSAPSQPSPNLFATHLLDHRHHPSQHPPSFDAGPFSSTIQPNHSDFSIPLESFDFSFGPTQPTAIDIGHPPQPDFFQSPIFTSPSQQQHQLHDPSHEQQRQHSQQQIPLVTPQQAPQQLPPRLLHQQSIDAAFKPLLDQACLRPFAPPPPPSSARPVPTPTPNLVNNGNDKFSVSYTADLDFPISSSRKRPHPTNLASQPASPGDSDYEEDDEDEEEEEDGGDEVAVAANVQSRRTRKKKLKPSIGSLWPGSCPNDWAMDFLSGIAGVDEMDSNEPPLVPLFAAGSSGVDNDNAVSGLPELPPAGINYQPGNNIYSGAVNPYPSPSSELPSRIPLPSQPSLVSSKQHLPVENQSQPSPKLQRPSSSSKQVPQMKQSLPLPPTQQTHTPFTQPSPVSQSPAPTTPYLVYDPRPDPQRPENPTDEDLLLVPVNVLMNLLRGSGGVGVWNTSWDSGTGGV